MCRIVVEVGIVGVGVIIGEEIARASVFLDHIAAIRVVGDSGILNRIGSLGGALPGDAIVGALAISWDLLKIVPIERIEVPFRKERLSIRVECRVLGSVRAVANIQVATAVFRRDDAFIAQSEVAIVVAVVISHQLLSSLIQGLGGG